MKVITFGRSSKSDVVIRDAYVGRIHMQIVLDNDGNIYAIDLNSTNGTYVNGQRIYGKVRLQKNDIIRIGNTTLPWQKYISPNTIIIYRNKTILYIIIIILILLLVCAGVYVWRINSTSVPQPHKTHQDYDTSQPSNYAYHAEITRSKNEKPSINSIPYDLIGHKLSEGISDGYYDKGWTFSIENNSITNFSIDEVLTNDNSNYLIVSSFHLKGGNNFYYDTHVKISYINNGDGWELNYVNSLGMFVVSDGQYDDCIICEMPYGPGFFMIHNISECSLVVGGHARTSDGWKKFLCPVSPHDNVEVGGFGSSFVHEYIIDFVIREK